MHSPLFIGSHIIHLESVDSTNKYALELLKENRVFEGTVIMAQNQFAGKGQRNNVWQSEPGKNITLSIVLFPKNLKAENQFYLTQFVSLALNELIETSLNNTENCRIKWPNDIYYGDKKLAGVLIENTLRNNFIYSTVIGIGLNVNQVNFDSSLLNATSLTNISGKAIDIEALCKNLFSLLEKYYLMINKGISLKEMYLNKLYQLNTIANYTYKGEAIEAIIKDVAEDGKLILQETKENTLIKTDLKEIVFG